jgi:hypothetical protein
VIRGRLFVFSSFVVRPLHCLVNRFVQLIAASKEATASRVPLSKVEVLKSFKIPVQEEFEDTKGIIRIRKSKDRQHNGQKKKYKKDK